MPGSPDAECERSALLASGAVSQVLGGAQGVVNEARFVASHGSFLLGVAIRLDQPPVRLFGPALVVVSPRCVLGVIVDLSGL